ncbi:MAG: hypothetical protein KAW02_04215 [candidate division Zixibacteria bacterium]|nr:hypothetical protein [candidate division Zixibacteria bacterium]
MEKKQYELCLEILRRFHKAKILNHLVLIGSWSVFFYKDYFSSKPSMDYTALKTRDMDFLISMPDKIEQVVDIPTLLKDLGFVTTHRGDKGYMKLDHPDLIVEFLVPEKGKGIDKPYPLPKLGVNAQTLRFLDLLSDNTMKVKIEDFYLTLPHPANFALHKLIVSQRRNKEDKAIKDRDIAIKILRALINKGEVNIINNVFNSIPKSWQRKIIKGLKEAKEKEALEILQKSD